MVFAQQRFLRFKANQQHIPMTEKLPSSLEEPNDKHFIVEKWEDAIFYNEAPIKKYVSKCIYDEMNLRIKEVPKIIKVHEKLTKTK